MRHLRARLLILGLLSALIGCTESTDSTLSTEDLAIPTSVTVSPQAFLGSVPCSNEVGALRSYVATLTDVTDPAADKQFTLPSSPPTPCADAIVFRYIVVDHRYEVAIAGYPLYASELTPAQNPSSGSSTMLRTTTGKAVLPRWTSSCEGAVARLNDEVNFTSQECKPLALRDTESSTTGVRVDPRASLGLLACEGQGLIVSFDITPQDPTLPPILRHACGDSAIEYAEGIKAGKTYTFAVHALAVGDKKLSASCSAKAQAGLVVAAVCDPLTLDAP